MTHGKQCRSTALCACLAAVALFAPTSAGAAEPAAVGEYTLTLPGVGKTGIEAPSPLAEKTERAGPIGVVGEQDDGFTRLGAVSSAVLTPAGIAIVALTAVGMALAARRRGAQS